MNFLIVNMKIRNFFQDLLLNNIKGLKFDSAFEAGCIIWLEYKSFKMNFLKKKLEV